MQEAQLTLVQFSHWGLLFDFRNSPEAAAPIGEQRSSLSPLKVTEIWMVVTYYVEVGNVRRQVKL